MVSINSTYQIEVKPFFISDVFKVTSIPLNGVNQGYFAKSVSRPAWNSDNAVKFSFYYCRKWSFYSNWLVATTILPCIKAAWPGSTIVDLNRNSLMFFTKSSVSLMVLKEFWMHDRPRGVANKTLANGLKPLPTSSTVCINPKLRRFRFSLI